MIDAEEEGVIPVPMPMTEGETMQSQIMNERRSRGLKYDEPAIASLTKAKLTEEMQEFLLATMDGERMSDELVEYWLRKENPDLTKEVDEVEAVPALREEDGFAYEEREIDASTGREGLNTASAAPLYWMG